jgi:CO/xanthine dehydrogenase FAD-binding subunit
MRSDVAQFNLSAPPSLDAVLAQLAAEPGKHTPIAGGTELMVALNTGRLTQHSLVSIHQLKELRFIRAEQDAIHIGSGATFTDIRRSAEIAADLPLLIESASWTGTIANQNRATLGGNICNASPAADTPPALLAYGASITLISASATAGKIATRTLPYTEFHLAYKKTVLRPEELVHSVSVPRNFSGYRQYIRKVGTRNALAISKIALAALAKLDGDALADIRLGAASLTDRPVRCSAAEAALLGKSVGPKAMDATVRAARAALASETHTIDDIRSTAKYRSAVAGNLLEEFLRSLAV